VHFTCHIQRLVVFVIRRKRCEPGLAPPASGNLTTLQDAVLCLGLHPPVYLLPLSNVANLYFCSLLRHANCPGTVATVLIRVC